MTEEEASKKRCTPALVVLLMDQERRDGLAAAGKKIGVNCIGSACAQWTWFDYVDDKGRTWRPAPADGTEFTKGRATKDITRRECAGRGYCGLTGGRS